MVVSIRAERRRRRTSWSVPLVALALLGTACRGGATIETDIARPVPMPVPIEEPPPPPMGGEPAPEPDPDGATRVERHPEAGGSRPVEWERVAFNRDDQQLQVFWWSGVEPCTVLDDVTVDFLEEEVVVTVLEGAPPEAATISCIAIAQYKTYTLDLTEDPGSRRFVDGAKR